MKTILLALFSFSLFAQKAPAQSLVHSATLAWTDPVNPAGTTYNAYRLTGVCPGTAPTSTSGFTKLASAITAKTYVDLAVTAGATYCYVVTAIYTGASESAPSNDVQGIVPATFPAQAPQTLSVSTF